MYIRTKLFKLRYILVHSFSFSFLFCQGLIRKKQTILPSIANIFFLVQTFTIYFLLIRDLPSFGLYMVLYNNILNQCGSDSDYCQFFAGGMTGVDFYIFLLFNQINKHRYYLPNIFPFLKKVANYFDKNIHLNSSLFFYG